MIETRKKTTKAKTTNAAALEFKGSLLTTMVLHLQTSEWPAILQELEAKVRQAPGLFQQAPVVIELDSIRQALDFATLASALRQHGMIPLGIRGGGEELQELARQAGLPALPAGKPERPSRQKTAEVPPPVTQTVTQVQEVPTKILTQPVRSGQQVVSKGDLIVLSMVSRGAEILAQRHIHVYGALRGRALAGVNGDSSARIICQQFDAELVAVAGQYQVNEEFDRTLVDKPAQIYLDNNNLIIEPFGG
jgi:septum site-determining protein MinC